MSTTEILLEVAEKLPPDATLVDGIYELEFRQAVEGGLAELDRVKVSRLRRSKRRSPNGLESNHCALCAGLRADALRQAPNDGRLNL